MNCFLSNENRSERIEADPVSISIAYHAANRARVDEDNVSYGFKKTPVDQPRRKIVPNIPEEQLWSDDRIPVEFKKEDFHGKAHDDADDIDDDENDERVRSNPRYDDLGYVPVVKIKVAKRCKILDFKLDPLKSKDDERSEFDEEDCICKRSKFVRLGEHHDDLEESLDT